jgi:hypothetical protein
MHFSWSTAGTVFVYFTCLADICWGVWKLIKDPGDATKALYRVAYIIVAFVFLLFYFNEDFL